MILDSFGISVEQCVDIYTPKKTWFDRLFEVFK